MSTGVYRTTTWALCDQAIVSGGNFVTNLVLIRTLAPTSYGAYALVLNAVLLLNNLHSSMVTYPVCMRGARSDHEELGRVAMGGLLATFLGVLVNAVLITAACISIQRPLLIPIVIGAALFWQFQETLRTVFVSRLAYKRALTGDAFSYLGQAAVLAVICWHHVPSLIVVFAVILGTSLLAGIGQAFQIRPTQLNSASISSFFSVLWQLGKWTTLAKIVAYLSFQAFPWLLAYSAGLPAVASFQSLFQLVALSNPLMLSFNNLIVASIASQNSTSGAGSWAGAIKQMRFAAVLLGSYFLSLAIFGRLFMTVIYGSHSPYLANASLLRFFALAYALEAIAMFAGAIIAGLGETRFNFIAQLCAMSISVLFVFPWIMHSGLKAAVIGLIPVAATRAIATWFFARRGLERQNRSDQDIQWSSTA